MNAGQTAWLSFLQQIQAYQAQMDSYISANLPSLVSAHPCSAFEGDVNAYKSALDSAVSGPLAQIASDVNALNVVGNIS